jgi:hemoglobin
VNFWETVLLDSKNYFNNAMNAHRHIHSLSPFKPEHFKQWVTLFCETVDELYTGKIAENAKQKATSVGSAMTLFFIEHK